MRQDEAKAARDNIKRLWELRDRPRCERAYALGSLPLADGEWWSVPQLCGKAEKLEAFDGITESALSRAVRSAIHQLHRFKIVEIFNYPNGTVPAHYLLVRRPLKPDPGF